MINFANCEDIRQMKTFEEIDCPHCGAKAGIEVIIQDGLSVGESICDECGYTLPKGVHIPPPPATSGVFDCVETQNASLLNKRLLVWKLMEICILT